jgi:mono/diheme cytochrome c family protein
MIRVAIVALSALALALLGVAAARSSAEAWVGHQRRYAELSLRKGGSGTPEPVEVKQDRFLGFGDDRIDRCRSCHVAVADPRFAGEEQPLRTHPSVAPHALNELGCTVCHEGDGRALDRDLAHGKDPFWPEPLLVGAAIESSCARCHLAPFPAQMPHLRRGAELFAKKGCLGCHTVQGIARGTLGAELTDVGTRRTLDFFVRKLKEPAFNAPGTLMPRLRLTGEEVADVAVYLKSLKGRPLAEDPVSHRIRTRRWATQAPREVPVTAEAGRQAVEARGCLGCHKLGPVDGGLAPDLGYLGLVRDADYVAAHLADPRAHTPGSSMPGFWMAASERRAIGIYLTSLASFARPAAPADQYAQLCARCHGVKGAGDGPAAETLLPRPRVFTNAKFFNWLPEERAHRAIRDGVPGTAMPPFGKILDEEGAQALFAWVRRAFIGEQRTTPAAPRRVPERNPVAYSAESVARGKAAFAERCYGCHGRQGDGRGPNAAEMLPRPRNLANRAFFEGLADSRLFESITYGVVGTGMPPWDVLPDAQRWDLVNYVRHLSSTGPAVSERRK